MSALDQNSKRFCTNCGCELAGDHSFCPHCGAKQEGVSNAAVFEPPTGRPVVQEFAYAQPQQPTALPIAPQQSEKRGLRVPFQSQLPLIAGVILLFFCVLQLVIPSIAYGIYGEWYFSYFNVIDYIYFISQLLLGVFIIIFAKRHPNLIVIPLAVYCLSIFFQVINFYDWFYLIISLIDLIVLVALTILFLLIINEVIKNKIIFLVICIVGLVVTLITHIYNFFSTSGFYWNYFLSIRYGSVLYMFSVLLFFAACALIVMAASNDPNKSYH